MGRDEPYWQHREPDSFTRRQHTHGRSYRTEGDEETGDPCARGSRCESRDYQGNPKRCPRPFCDKDRGWIIRSIQDLPRDYASLRDDLLPRSSQQEERVSGSKEPPIPLAADVQAFMRELCGVALSWEHHVRAANRLSPVPPERRRDEIALWHSAEILSEHADSLIALPAVKVTRHATRKRLQEIEDAQIAAEQAGEEPAVVRVWWDASGDAWEEKTMTGVEAALELLALHGRAYGMLGRSRQRRRITEVDCDECGAKSLFQREAIQGGWDPEVRCGNCPAVYTGRRLTLLSGRIYEAQLGALDDHDRAQRITTDGAA